MFKGFYTVATGMIAQQRRTEILTNNMANANTPGFKADQSTIRSFPDMLMSAVNSNQIPTKNGFGTKTLSTVGALNTGVYLQETLANHTQGSIYETGLLTDVALLDEELPVDAESGEKGAIFFRLRTENGEEAYTRNGNFTVDGSGNLVNPNGLYVLSSTGETIQLPNENFTIRADGVIVNDNNEQISQLDVAFSVNPDTLAKRDNGLFQTANNANLPSAYGLEGVSFSMKQNYLESSNVDSGRSMTDLMTSYRIFEANQKVLQAYDRSMDKAVNELGKV